MSKEGGMVEGVVVIELGLEGKLGGQEENAQTKK